MKSIQPIISTALFLCISVHLSAQTLPTNELPSIFQPNFPTQLDTLYYPFYQGVQMIEIDHLSYWDRRIYALEQARPRALPWSREFPMPPGNEYIFRDSTGTIVKAYNTFYRLDSLTARFSKIPILQKNRFPLSALLSHKYPINAEGVWAYSPNLTFYFQGLRKVFCLNTDSSQYPCAESPCYGLIDSLGELVIPFAYQEILPLQHEMLVKKGNKWGVINKHHEIRIPLLYDKFDNYYSNVSSDNVFFLKEGKFSLVYLLDEQKTIPLNEYDKVLDTHQKHGVYAARVMKDKKMGVIGKDFIELIPPVYDKVNPCGNYGGYRVENEAKYGFLDSLGREIVPVQYDKVGSCFIRDRLLLQKGNTYGFADRNGEIVIPLTFTYASPFYYKTAIVRISPTAMGLIDRGGKIIASFEGVQHVRTFPGGYYSIKKDKKIGLVDYLGNEVVPCKYDNISRYGYTKTQEITLILNGQKTVMKLKPIPGSRE